MASWSVPRKNSDMIKGGGKIEGETSFEAVKSSSGTVMVEDATNESQLYFQGSQITGLKAPVQGGYQWSVTAQEFEAGYNAASGKSSVTVECTNTGASPNLLINTENHFSLIPS